ncbi:MAG: DMT family transporter [Cyclobacteriaceae bacterium]|jgi:drug/metabolite transporter (DMT)-like permease|nr:DMT family transporter [Cyclobacteriaceae bacterium]MDH4294911.1 DMT family transporter [Cyclobacteriaceae bacterium]MDH5249372.1 DMT family transporter [Cyclobacteriaceae bacterium]
MTDNPRSSSYILLGVLSLMWGTSFILIKQGLKVFTPDEVGSLRVASASLFLLPLAMVHVRTLNPAAYWKLFISGMMGIFIPAFLYATAQTRMDSSVAGIINTLTPLFTMMVGAIVFKQRFRGYVIIGIILGFAGTILLSLSRSGSSVTGFNNFTLLIVLACLLYGSNLNFIKFSIPELSAPAITSVSLMLIGPFAFVYLLGFTGFTEKMETHPGAWKAFGFITLLGFMSTAVATILFNKLVKIATPMFASSVTYLMPIVVVMWGVLDGELLNTGHFIGMAAILGGVYLANRWR